MCCCCCCEINPSGYPPLNSLLMGYSEFSMVFYAVKSCLKSRKYPVNKEFLQRWIGSLLTHPALKSSKENRQRSRRAQVENCVCSFGLRAPGLSASSRGKRAYASGEGFLRRGRVAATPRSLKNEKSPAISGLVLLMAGDTSPLIGGGQGE